MKKINVRISGAPHAGMQHGEAFVDSIGTGPFVIVVKVPSGHTLRIEGNADGAIASTDEAIDEYGRHEGLRVASDYFDSINMPNKADDHSDDTETGQKLDVV